MHFRLPFLQAEKMLGIKADDLAELKKNEPERFEQQLKRAQWGEWVMTVSSEGGRFLMASCRGNGS